jgi:hypothetical protein
MRMPGETEAGSAGMQPCRGIAWRAHRNDVDGRESSPFALFLKTHRIGRPLCLENPRPEGAEYSLTESAPSPFHAEPAHPGHLRPILRQLQAAPVITSTESAALCRVSAPTARRYLKEMDLLGICSLEKGNPGTNAPDTVRLVDGFAWLRNLER